MRYFDEQYTLDSFRDLLKVDSTTGQYHAIPFFILMPLLLLYAALTGFPASILRAAICFAIA